MERTVADRFLEADECTEILDSLEVLYEALNAAPQTDRVREYRSSNQESFGFLLERCTDILWVPPAREETPHDKCANEPRPEPFNTCYQYWAARLGFEVPDFSIPTPTPSRTTGGDSGTCTSDGSYCVRVADVGDWTCSQERSNGGPWVTGYCTRITDIGDWTCSQEREGNGPVITGYCTRVTEINGQFCSQERDGLTGTVRTNYCSG